MIRFLTAEEVAELTGFVRPAAQKRWLSENDFSFVEGGDGRPKVLEEVVLSRLGARQAKKDKGPRLRLTG